MRIVRDALTWGSLLLSALILIGVGVKLMPRAHTAALMLHAADDPAALAELRLAPELTASRVAAEVEAALASEDDELAQSFLALADARQVPIATDLRARVVEMQSAATSRAVRAFANGVVSGEADSAMGLVGALAADLAGIGDLRDLAREGQRYARGEDCDEVALGMATAGLAASAATYAGGLGAPFRSGLTILKVARRTGQLSRPLAGSLAQLVHQSVDLTTARGLLTAAGRLDLDAARTAARAAVRPTALASLRNLGADAYALHGRTGSRGVMQVLSFARSPAELTLAVRLSERMGPATRAVLTLLGRTALVIGSVLAELVRTVLLAILWCCALALFCRQLGVVIGRMIWHHVARRRDVAAGKLIAAT